MKIAIWPLFLLFFSSLFADQFVELQEELRQAEAQFERAKKGYMFGNWEGWRYKIANKGVNFISSYFTDMIGNPVGGAAQGFAYCGSLGLAMDVDFERAADIPGFEFFVSAVWRTGTNLSRTKIKNQFPVQQLFGSETVKLNELYLRESLFDGRWILKAGRLNAGNDFLQSNLYYQFVSNAFDGNPVAIFFNIPTFSAYPNATWGAYTSFIPYERVLAKAAIYNANSKISRNSYHGLNFTFESTNGAVLVSELSYLVNQEEDDEGMAGTYKVGYVYLTGATQTFSNRTVDGDWSAYAQLEQVIYRPDGGETNRALSPFLALLFSPKEKNLFPFYTIAGLVYQGPFANRPDDSFNLGVAYGKYSTDLANAEAQSGKPKQNYEAVVELNYWFQVNQWCVFTPDFQFIIHPRGLEIPNAFCIGAQIGFIL